MENTDVIKRINELDSIIKEKQKEKLESDNKLDESRETEKQLNESKIKFEIYKEDNKKLLSIDSDLNEINNSIDEIMNNKSIFTEKVAKTTQEINRWEQFTGLKAEKI